MNLEEDFAEGKSNYPTEGASQWTTNWRRKEGSLAAAAWIPSPLEVATCVARPKLVIESNFRKQFCKEGNFEGTFKSLENIF